MAAAAPDNESIYKLLSEGRVAAERERAAPRVRPGAKPAVPAAAKSPPAKAKMADHRNSSQVANLFNPIRGVRDVTERKGGTPVNHARNNLIAVREASSRNQLKKMEPDGTKNRPAGYVPKAVRGPAPAPRPPSAEATGPLASRDFVRENAVDAGTAACLRQKPAEAPPGTDWKQKENYGKVPAYLQERKVELAEAAAARKAAEEAEAVPPGMRLLPEAERLQTLELLGKSRAETERQLQRMPFNVETPSQIRMKAELEGRLKEIEEAERAFSRKRIFVRA